MLQTDTHSHGKHSFSLERYTAAPFFVKLWRLCIFDEETFPGQNHVLHTIGTSAWCYTDETAYTNQQQTDRPASGQMEVGRFYKLYQEPVCKLIDDSFVVLGPLTNPAWTAVLIDRPTDK